MTRRRAGAVISRAPIIPDRVRRIGGESFAFVPHRFLRDGFLATLTHDELTLYVILVLAGDRNGVSFYHYDSLCALMCRPIDAYLDARNALIAKDLIAFDGTRYQVLSLPERAVPSPVSPLRTAEDFERHDPATIRQLILDALDRDED